MLLRDSQSSSLRKPSSVGIETYTDTGGIIREVEYIRCKHCGYHFEHKPGSGIWKQRGWCHPCGGYVCGSPICVRYCIPYEARIDHEDGFKTNYDDIIDQLVREGALVV